MRYYWIKYDLDYSRGISISSLSKEELNGEQPILKKIEIKKDINERVLQDYLTTRTIKNQYHIVSDNLKKLMTLYNPNKEWTPVVLIDQDNQQYLYWFVTAATIDCISKKTEMNFDRTVKELVLDKEKLTRDSVFFVETELQKMLVLKLDIVESMLRRGMFGFKLKKIKIAGDVYE